VQLRRSGSSSNLPDIIDLSTSEQLGNDGRMDAMKKRPQELTKAELYKQGLRKGLRDKGPDYFILTMRLVRAKKLDLEQAEEMILRYYL